MKRLAVIILNWNGLALLREYLPAAALHTIDDDTDLIVADNGSTDGSAEYVEREFPQVRVLRLGENYGYAEGYDRALAATRYEFTILLNSDVEVTPGWTRPLLAALAAHGDIGAAQPKIRSLRRREMFEYAGAAGGYIDRLGFPYCRGRLFDRVEADRGQYDSPEPVDIGWASGAALAVRTDLFLRLGGLDARFFAHMEEIDLCCRIHAAGYRVVAVTDSVVYHLGGASLAPDNPRKTYLNFRNNLLMLHKNLPRRRGRSVLLRRRLVDTLAFGMFLLKGEFAHARAVLKAHGDFRRMRRLYTDLPATDTLRTMPGADRYALADRYLRRRRR